MSENFTLEELFVLNKSNYENQLMTTQQIEKLKILHDTRGNWGITLSQADNWMIRAGVIKKKTLSLTETGMIFSQFK